jgi:hypothetical protein
MEQECAKLCTGMSMLKEEKVRIKADHKTALAAEEKNF